MPDLAVRLGAAFWPGPLTLVLHRSARVPDEVTAGLETVAVRVPAHPVARALVAAAGVPVAAPSANVFSRPSPTEAGHVADDLGAVLDVILDGGPTSVGVESTVLDLTAATPTVLRPGGISLERLRQIVPDVRLAEAQTTGDGAMPSPGMLTRHYAPRTPLTLYEGGPDAIVVRVVNDASRATAAGEAVAIMGTRDVLTRIQSLPAIRAAQLVQYIDLGSAGDPDSVAAHLYSRLRDCDAIGVRRVLTVQIADDRGLWLAIRDRLRRASAGLIVTC
jgi:L-threonylcarbamoyladenylate synthase